EGHKNVTSGCLRRATPAVDNSRLCESKSNRIRDLAETFGRASSTREGLLDDLPLARLPPAQMLSAIQRDHLTGHSGRREDEAQRGGYLFGAGASSLRPLTAAVWELLCTLQLAWSR